MQRGWSKGILLLFVVCGILAYLALYDLRPRPVIDLRASELRYDTRVGADSLSARARALGVKVAPGTGVALSLTCKTRSGWVRYTDAAHISGVFDAAATEAGYIAQGRSMLFSLVAVVVLAFAYQTTFASWSLWISLLAVPAGAAIYESCPACAGLERSALAIAPLLAVALVGLLWMLLSVSVSRKATWFAVGLGCLVWLGQMTLIATAPKFCLACLSLGLANCALITLACARLDGSNVRLILLPRGIKGVAYSGLAAVILLQSGYASGLVTPNLAKSREVPQLEGKDIRGYVPKISLVKQRILVVTREGCVYCERAMAALAARNIPFQNVPVNLGDRSTVTFDESKTPVLTPLILVVNDDNKISLAHSGWPSSLPGQTTLIETLASVRRKK